MEQNIKEVRATLITEDLERKDLTKTQRELLEFITGFPSGEYVRLQGKTINTVKALKRRGLISDYHKEGKYVLVKHGLYDDTLCAALYQLTYSTGGNILDSGGAYGRHWSRNQTLGYRGLMNRPYSTVDWDVRNDELCMDGFTVNVLDWIQEKLSYDKEMNRLFTAFCELEEHEEKSGLELAGYFPAWLHKEFSISIASGPYGEDEIRFDKDGYPLNNFTGYTYNEQNLLSQDLHYTRFKIDGTFWFQGYEYSWIDEYFCIISIHNGCDARWGFTVPVVYSESEECSMYDTQNGVLSAGDRYWDTYDAGYSWRPANDEPDIFELPLINLDEEPLPEPPYYDQNTVEMFGYNELPAFIQNYPIPLDTEHVYWYDNRPWFAGHPIEAS